MASGSPQSLLFLNTFRFREFRPLICAVDTSQVVFPAIDSDIATGASIEVMPVNRLDHIFAHIAANGIPCDLLFSIVRHNLASELATGIV